MSVRRHLADARGQVSIPSASRSVRHPLADARGQASILLTAGLAGILVAVLIVAVVARSAAGEADAQRVADLAAVAAGKAMQASYFRLFEPAWLEHEANPRHLEKADYLQLGRDAALAVARANDMSDASVSFPDERSMAPMQVRVEIHETLAVGHGGARRTARIGADAEAELGLGDMAALTSGGDGYDGPLSYRQGKPMRPDVALAFDRLAAAADADGIALVITSGYRSDAEQALLWAQHPDPKWVARPGTSLHRLGTELDLGPESAYDWLAANAPRFHFVQRYAWEPWHFGFNLNAGSGAAAGGTIASGTTPAGAPATGGGDSQAEAAHGPVPGFVPAQYAPLLRTAAQRWNVSAALLAAQLYAESGFNPFARSSAGAIGIAQFMPGTAASYGIDPADPAQAIDAQAHLMRDLLRQLGSVPLALAAYNAGPGAVSACGCIPQNGETPGYVAKILALMSGAGEPVAAENLIVRLIT